MKYRLLCFTMRIYIFSFWVTFIYFLINTIAYEKDELVIVIEK